MKMKASSTPSIMVPRGSTISKCTCEHAYQDAKYGKQKRVFNIGAKGNICTVCGVRHDRSS